MLSSAVSTDLADQSVTQSATGLADQSVTQSATDLADQSVTQSATDLAGQSVTQSATDLADQSVAQSATDQASEQTVVQPAANEQYQPTDYTVQQRVDHDSIVWDRLSCTRQTLIAMQQQLQCQMAVTVQQQHSGHQQWQQLGQQHSTLQQQWHHVQQQQQCIQQLQSEVQRIQAQQSQQLDLFVHPQNQAAHCKLCGLGQRVTDLEQQQQAQISQLEAAMAQQTQNQIQCALHQQQQARISDLEAERAVTAQRVEAQVQTALIEHQHQQQTQIAQLVQEQMHLYTEQHQTETGGQERELKKLQKQLDRQRSNTDNQFRELRRAAPADSDSDSEQQSQLQAQCTQLQLQHSQLQIQCTQLQTQHTELTAEHEQLKSQFSCSLNSNLQAELTQLTAKHEQLQSQYTESVTEYAEAHKRQKDQHSSQIGNLRSQYQQCLQQYASIETAVRGTLEEWWVAADASLIERVESSVRTEPDTPQSVQLSIEAGSEVPAEQQSEMTAAQQHLQTQICELDQRLTEMQTEHSGNDPELPSVAQLSDRSRRKGRRQYNDRQKHQQRQLLSQQQLQKHQQLQLLSQCTELEAQLRASVRGEGTTAERMVKVFRAALHSFRVLVKGHALSSVQSAIYRELNGDRHSDSMTREYCSGTAHQQRVGLTDYCMCDREHTASMTSTTVGAVLIKHSIRWHIRRQVHSWWLYWRERHLLAAQQMAAVAARTPSTATGGADTESAAAEGAASEGAAAEGATAEQNCAPDSSDCSVQLMAAFASMHRVWEQHWGTVSEREGGVHPDYCSSRELSSRDQGADSWGMTLLIESESERLAHWLLARVKWMSTRLPR